MQLLVYARNRTPAEGGESKTFVGLAIGENPQVVLAGPEGGPETTSYVEVRISADTIDLLTAVPLLVAKAIAREPRANRRPVVLACTEGVVRLKLEPGFSDAKQLCAPLMPLLSRCRVYGDGATPTPTALDASLGAPRRSVAVKIEAPRPSA